MWFEYYFKACSFGYHAGGWGKPPVDENGKPLYGDVFGTQSADFQVNTFNTQVIYQYTMQMFRYILSTLK
jgi:hypothetical protein